MTERSNGDDDHSPGDEPQRAHDDAPPMVGDHPEVVELTRELVAVPVGGGESTAGDRVETWLREHAPGTVLRDDHGNVFALRTPDGEGIAAGDATASACGLGDAGDVAGPDSVTGRRALAFVGHHDVVPPDDEQVDADGRFRFAVDDGRVRGRGTADMKGSVAAAMLAFRDATLDGEHAPDRDLVFASFVGEEAGGVGCRGAIADGFAPEWAVVGEGSTGYSAMDVTDVAVAHKGRRAVTVTATGVPAHASVPDDGENAIYRAADAVDVLRDLDWPAVDVAGESLSGSVVVTEVDGGSAWNVVPERCTVTVDERTVPGERAAVDRVESLEGVDWTVEQDLPPMRCRDDAFVDAVLAAARETQTTTPSEAEQTATPTRVTKPHATDAGWLDDRAGTACVVYGPAEPGEAHTANESASVAVLERCYETYRAVAERSFC